MVICMHIFIEFYLNKAVYWSFPGGTVVKNPPTNAGDTRDTGSIPWWGRSPSVGNGDVLQYSHLGNPIDRGGSVQFSSVTQSCPTLCDPMDCSMPSLPVNHQLPEFTQTHVHKVGDAIQPSHPVIPFSCL